MNPNDPETRRLLARLREIAERDLYQARAEYWEAEAGILRLANRSWAREATDA